MSTAEQFFSRANLGSPIVLPQSAVIVAAKDESGNAAPLLVNADGELIVAGVGGGGSDATAANQVTGNTRLGDVTETAPANDTASSGINGRLQRIAQRLTTFLSVFGATTDAKSTATDATPVTAISVWKQISASVQGWLTVVGKAAVVTATMTRPADTNAYLANDLFGSTVSNSANNIMTLAVARAHDATAIISRIRAKINDSAFAAKRIKFHLYKAQPTVSTIGDNGGFSSGSAATESNKIGTATVTFDGNVTSDGYVKGFTYPDDTAGVIWTCEPSSGTQNIFAIAEVLDAVTPGSAKVLTLTLEIAGQN